MELKLKLYRYEPQSGQESYQSVSVPYEEGMTFLSALQKVKEEIDPTLSFRAFCRAGICGTCAVLIDGFPKLACREQVLPYVLSGKEVVIEPLDKFKVIKDLVAEGDEVIKRMKELKLWVKEREKNIPIEPKLARELEKSADCILCFACHSYCPQVLEKEYAGPLLFAKIYRLFKDPRDAMGSERLGEALATNLYHCLSCNKCNNACPKEVEPATLIRELMLSPEGVS
ncbi:MAG: succinate dehydrogenase/fumarate reductase iron-sulfur subunit [Aquificae bacterium]|nr:succinate dehydrogenase/fumarate reductase iron-sulfur subunit [Aquificota bacterium]